MRNKKIKATWNGILYTLWYVALVVLCLLGVFAIAGIITKYSYNKSQKNFIRKVEVKKAKLQDTKFTLVEQMNKSESKLAKVRSEKKVNKITSQIEKYKKQIENINYALSTQIDEPKVDEKFLEKAENKIKEFKENVLD